MLSPAGVDRRAILAIVVTASAAKPTELTYRNDLLAQKSVTYDDLGGWQWILAEGINIQDMESHGVSFSCNCLPSLSFFSSFTGHVPYVFLYSHKGTKDARYAEF